MVETRDAFGGSDLCQELVFHKPPPNVSFKVLGNHTEFQRVATILQDTVDFDIDVNASVFETNIRGEEGWVLLVFPVNIIPKTSYFLMTELVT